MKVSELLQQKGSEVATINQSQLVGDAVQLLRERGIGALVVVGANPPLVGILSERDVVRALAQGEDGVLSQRVSELMTTDVSVCSPSTSTLELMELMTKMRVRHIPVTDEGTLVGIVSIGDVVHARLRELEREKSELLEYVSAR
jgi:CBS domain-containing protein